MLERFGIPVADHLDCRRRWDFIRISCRRQRSAFSQNVLFLIGSFIAGIPIRGMAKPKPGSKPTTKPSTPKAPPPSSIPAPFSPAPEKLKTFLSTLSPNHIYITSLDSHPRDFKRRIFAVPLILNIFLAILLLYRLQFATVTYFSIFTAILGYDSPAKIDTKNSDALSLLGTVGERVLMFTGDFVLVRFVGLWPWGFFLGTNGESSPVGWRRWIGFRDVEIVIRRSRRWDVPLFTKEDGSEEPRGAVREQWLDEGREGKVFAKRVLPAVERNWVKNKTSYLMLDQNWDLFFTGMLKAHALCDAGENALEDFRTAVLVYSERSGWLSWEVWKDHGEGTGDEGTRKLQLIKDKLTLMGKENLFFRWIEVVQSETSQTGPFTAERQKKAVQKIKEEFKEREVDFDEFWADVGGVESMPGMEITC